MRSPLSRPLTLLALAAAMGAAPLVAQMPKAPPGAPIASRVTAGTYKADPMHSYVSYAVDHLGFSTYRGIFGNVTGTTTLDPKRIEATKVDITVPLSGLVNASADLTKHMLTPDFFDAARHPNIRFVSTRVTRLSATTARLDGNLTVRGVTKPVSLAVRFHGAGKSVAMNGAPSRETVGFDATTTIRRSDFGVSYAVPIVSDLVRLDIAVAFEKQ